jgi:hypothetical protein
MRCARAGAVTALACGLAVACGTSATTAIRQAATGTNASNPQAVAPRNACARMASGTSQIP